MLIYVKNIVISTFPSVCCHLCIRSVYILFPKVGLLYTITQSKALILITLYLCWDFALFVRFIIIVLLFLVYTSSLKSTHVENLRKNDKQYHENRDKTYFCLIINNGKVGAFSFFHCLVVFRLYPSQSFNTLTLGLCFKRTET